MISSMVQPRTPPSGIGLMTPWQVHSGQAQAIHGERQKTLSNICTKNPQRFVKKPPLPPELPTAAWINPPEKQQAASRWGLNSIRRVSQIYIRLPL
jgi:hypothetical protein